MSGAASKASLQLGRKVYGDNLSLSEIERWFADEAEAYHALTQTYQNGYSYAYHALNIEHGFRYLPHRLFRRVLGIGASGRGTLLAQNAQQLELAGA